MKKIIVLLLSFALCLGLSACGDSTADTSPISDSEVEQFFTAPDNFKGRTFEFTGRVIAVEKDSEGLAVQAFYDIENYDKNIITYYSDPSLQVADDDFILVKGTVIGEFMGENAFGGTVSAPMLEAESVEVVDYQTAVSPAKRELTLTGATINQKGYSVTIDKIDFAESETRVYVTISNNGSDTFNLFTFDAKIIQDGKQMDTQNNYDANYPEISSDLKVGATTSGIICFPAIDEKDFSLLLSAYSDNYRETINDFEFNIEVN